ncbi:MAG: DUF4364 family protein [Ruminococcus sp.]|nr:DUF4364 family protein [Ruminococcus sp.]
MLNLNDVYEAKILLAYFLFQIDRPCTPMQLVDICEQSGVMDYFLYSAAITDMQANGTVDLVNIEGVEQYVLSDKGREGAESFKEIVPPSLRKKIYATGLMFFSRLKNERDVTFEVSEHGKGYLVRCICRDGGVTLMDISLYAPDKEQAEFIKAKISANPSAFYSQVMDYIIDNQEYLPDVRG